jgi:hypothetical protein
MNENERNIVREEWEKPVMKRLSLKDAETGIPNANDDGGGVWS